MVFETGKDLLGDNDFSIMQAINSLDHANPFVIFNLNLSDKEQHCLRELEVNQTDEYNNYGIILDLLSESTQFLQKIGNKKHTAECVAQITCKIVKDAILSSGKDSAWVAIRAFTQTKAFDAPRWHTDGNFFISDNAGNQYKFAITLKGASTLFYPLPAAMRDDFYAVQSSAQVTSDFDENVDKEAFKRALSVSRQKLNTMLDMSFSITADFGQGVVFAVGSQFAAVHSEPPIKAPRLLLSIVPGTSAQIEALYNRWHT